MELGIPPDDIFFNLILVQENVRPAMLIQTINYSKTIIKNILEYIELRFPNLILTKEYKGYQGIIVSKNDYTSECISSEYMGRILGYPYYSDFHKIINYAIEIFVIKSNLNIQLLANVCNDIDKLDEFNKIADNAENVLLKYGFNVKLKVVVTEILSYESVIKELLSDRELSINYINFINNQIWNYLTDGTSEDLPEICKHIDYSNKIHRGIIIAYLLNFKHDYLSVLYPLDGNIKEKVDKISVELSNNIIKILKY
jgi:hypothetical protein